MVCQTCESFKEERIKAYMQKLGLTREDALKRFNKVKPLIDKAVSRRTPSRLDLLRRWVFKTNWKATFLWSFIFRRLTWIGKGFNPDYTLACLPCSKSGSCGAGQPCGAVAECRIYFTCTGVCPSALPHSTLVSNTCACAKGGCSCLKPPYEPEKVCGGTIGTCLTPSGICGFDCDDGYEYKNGQCVPKAKAGLHPSKLLSIILNNGD